MIEFIDGMTVKQLKTVLESWPETNRITGESAEVWFGNGETNQAVRIVLLNEVDFLLESQ